MQNWTKKIINKYFIKESGSTVLGITFIVLLFRYLSLLQFPELSAYDFLFWLRSPEPKDERIVIVTWDENQLQMSQETIISDRTLANLIKKIGEQNPRYIGLDLFRDVIVTNPLLSDNQNENAYNELQKVFSSTSNLVGIEKVIPPRINPSKTLKEKGRITAADLLTDSDGRIRRAYIHPLEDEKGNPAEPPSLGIVLAYQYLAKEGYIAERLENNNALRLAKPDSKTEITLKPLKKLDGSYIKEEEGTKILINWRKGNPRFDRISASEVIAGLAPPQFFDNKIVLIGDTSASGSDIHSLPIDRWQSSSPQWTYGVEVHAQIASSIISAALDGRPLIKTIPEGIENGLIVLTIGSIVLIAQKYRHTRPWKLFLITTTSAAAIIFSLGVVAYISFEYGYWIPIFSSVLGGLVTPIIICTSIYINKINAANEDFKILLQDINHSLKNPISSLVEVSGFAAYTVSLLEQNDTKELEKLEKKFSKPSLKILKQSIQRVVTQIQKINYLRDNAQKYFAVAYLGSELFEKQPTDLNKLVTETLSNEVMLKQLEYAFAVEINEKYDNTIKDVRLDPSGIERVIENLIDNAFSAISDQMKEVPSHQGKISIQTQKKKNKIEIKIADNGIGMHESIIDQIFLPWKSFTSTGKGQGLGLSIVRETLRLHNGDIKVRSQPGQGSEFIIELDR